MEYTQYTTLENDRWDSIAYKAYGDANKYGLIVRANPNVSWTPLLPAGLKLNVPIVEREELNANLLPPWKR